VHSSRLHLGILACALIVLGLIICAWQIVVLGIPLREDESTDLWNIDAKIEFQAKENLPIKVQMFVPLLNQDYVSLGESFVSKNYGVALANAEGNRSVTWSARRASGKQILYYRLLLSKRYSGSEKAKEEGPTWREIPPLEGAEQVAVLALLEPIRQHSADIETFIGEAIRRINNAADDNVKLLLAGDTSVASKARVIERLLATAHIPVERVHSITLTAGAQQPELWLRSFNGEKWLYFDLQSGKQGLPPDRLVWWHGDAPLLSIDGGRRAQVSFHLSDSEINALRLASLTDQNMGSAFLKYSLYSLPIQTQQVVQVMLMIPLGVLLILLLRNLGGLQTLGTFTPVLIALAFRETGLGTGISLFILITALGLLLRAYLEHLKLQMLPRLSVVLTFVVLLIAGVSLASHGLGFENGLSVALFPMVILTMSIERLSITWEERGAAFALKAGAGTLLAATGAHLLMSVPALTYFVFTFPACLLALVGLMLLLGRYRGYRLSELLRFKALAG